MGEIYAKSRTNNFIRQLFDPDSIASRGAENDLNRQGPDVHLKIIKWDSSHQQRNTWK